MTAADITIAPLRPEQVGAAQRLLLESFDPRLQPYMTATQAGAEAFLAAYVAAPQLHPERRYLAATQADGTGDLLGYAEFRQLEAGAGFLSYICVSPLARGRGIASRLIEHYLQMVPEPETMQLDVFADNLPALALYRKLGFEEQSQTTWWRRPLPTPSETASLRVTNWPAALAMHKRYGFCEYQVSFADQLHGLGRMGQAVLRCTSAADFADDALLSAVRAALPELQEALLIAPDGPSPHAEAEAFNRSLRLRWHNPKPTSSLQEETTR